MSQASNSVADTAKAGGTVAICLFMVLYVLMLMSADSTTAIVKVFERSLLTVLFVFVPTSEVGAVVSVTAGLIGGAVSMDDFDPSIVRTIFVGGFIYTLTNIIINWFTVPV